MAYLDNNGLLYLWGKIKNYVELNGGGGGASGVIAKKLTKTFTSGYTMISSQEIPAGYAVFIQPTYIPQAGKMMMVFIVQDTASGYTVYGRYPDTGGTISGRAIPDGEYPLNVVAISLATGGSQNSHIGQIIHSTTLDTMEKVIEVYGGTMWIQHSGYMLRGASSGVTENSAASDGGAETVTLTAAQSGVPAHAHAHAHTHGTGDTSKKYFVKASGSFSSETVGAISGSGYKLYQIAESQTWGNMTATGGASAGNTSNNTAANASQAHNNMPPYKNVYIWERTA